MTPAERAALKANGGRKVSVSSRDDSWSGRGKRMWDYLVNDSDIGAPVRAVGQLMDSPTVANLGVQNPEDVINAFQAGGLASAGSAMATRPSNALASGAARPDTFAQGPGVLDVLKLRAKEMELKPDKRIQPRADRKRVLDQNYREAAPGAFAKDLSASYPRNPDPAAPLPLGDRGRILVDKKAELSKRLAEKIRGTGQMDADTRYFYHSDGPIYRAARESGLSHDEARKWLDDFGEYYAATSPRTETEQNLRNATLAMSKQAKGIPHRDVIGPGTTDPKTGKRGISEKGYPMMTGKGGIHGQLLDDVIAGRGIDVNTNTKPANFGPNTAGNRTGVTVDTHAIRGTLQALNEMMPGQVPEDFIMPAFRDAYKADPSKLTPDMIADTLGTQMIGPKGARVNAQTEYPVFADIWHGAADELGVSPAEAQSMGWFGLGGDTNLGSAPKTIADLIDERIDVTAQALGVPAQEAARLMFRREIPLMANPREAAGITMVSGDDKQRDRTFKPVDKKRNMTPRELNALRDGSVLKKSHTVRKRKPTADDLVRLLGDRS